MTFTKTVIITANSKRSVRGYRSEFIKKLQELGCEINVVSNIEAIFWFLRKRDTQYIFVSSDGRSNIVMLLFCWLSGMIILNGFGRYEKSKFIRFFIILLLRHRKNVICIIQNYRDYRYLSKYLAPNKFKWIPGSGGVARSTSKNKNNRKLIITRDSKFELLKNKVLDKKTEFKSEIDIIGLSEIWTEVGMHSLGRVPQANLFSKHHEFLQLYYYGEGIPHTLVDAFSSNLDIFMDRESFRNFGIYKYATAETELNGLLHLKPQKEGYQAYRSITSAETVVPMYVNELLSLQLGKKQN